MDKERDTLSIMPITGLPAGVLPPDVLVCGDPGRAALIAAQLTGRETISQQREYHSYRGSFAGHPVGVCSHGIGAPGAAIAFEELIAAGARRLLRVGTCGGIQPAVVDGHLVIASGAVQATGYGRQVAPAGYPAIADFHLTHSLAAAVTGHRPTHIGLVLSSDSFYPGITTPNTPDYPAMAQANVLAVEMECAALFLVGSLRGVATGAVLAVDGNVLARRESIEHYQPQRAIVDAAVTAAIELALRTLAATPL